MYLPGILVAPSALLGFLFSELGGDFEGNHCPLGSGGALPVHPGEQWRVLHGCFQSLLGRRLELSGSLAGAAGQL
jgi:hypothetical protein